MNVIASPFGIRNFENANISRNQILKRYFLLFDIVYVDQWGLGNDDNFFWRWLLNVTAPIDGDYEAHLKLKNNFKKSIVKLWDAVESAEEFENSRFKFINQNQSIFDGLGDFSFREIERLYGPEPTRWERKEYKGIIGDIWYDVAGNEVAKGLELGTIPNYSPYIGRALNNM